VLGILVTLQRSGEQSRIFTPSHNGSHAV
jgi:hypothetical protein